MIKKKYVKFWITFGIATVLAGLFTFYEFSFVQDVFKTKEFFLYQMKLFISYLITVIMYDVGKNRILNWKKGELQK
jgi:hypothetical protein